MKEDNNTWVFLIQLFLNSNLNDYRTISSQKAVASMKYLFLFMLFYPLIIYVGARNEFYLIQSALSSRL